MRYEKHDNAAFNFSGSFFNGMCSEEKRHEN